MDNPQVQGVVSQFLEHYYTTLDTDRSRLGPLYRENSTLTFSGGKEPGTPQTGTTEIVKKLVELPFQKLEHNLKELRIDVQLSPNNGILILVTGDLKVDGGDYPLPFSQIFQLFQDPAGQWFLFNDIFRLLI
ncbi:uncharacterized protein C8A04DRAFT_27025 [Dichotomopilus funicola]|uniref:NTF2-related export protein n=1 Tax=Dichotomopilus funicola TaxID=1934379 RepID=A0AAN6ZMY3_9PEZI|nr:hypothetical protein C8A04DRAFT_27025 [Dichotomopilus funicola]